jgi:hypothetical protein
MKRISILLLLWGVQALPMFMPTYTKLNTP